MVSPLDGWHTVLRIECHDTDSKRLLNDKGQDRITHQDNVSVLDIGFNINQSHDTPKHLARIGTSLDCDIILPEKFEDVDCCFYVNSNSGEILLHDNHKPINGRRKTSVDFRRRELDDDEFHDKLVHKGTKWAVVLHPDLSESASSPEERQYILKIGSLEFLLRPPIYGSRTYGPSTEVLRYMKTKFVTCDSLQHDGAVDGDKIKHVAHIVPYLHTEGLDQETTKLRRKVIVYMDVFEGSLADMIADGNFVDIQKGLPMLMQMVVHMATALSSIAGVNAVHRDVKPENVLYNGDKFYLTDFGLAKEIDNYATIVGTQVYQAPEVFDRKVIDGEEVKVIPHTSKIDIFGLGVTIAACLKSMLPPEMGDYFTRGKMDWWAYVQKVLGVLDLGDDRCFSSMAEIAPEDRPTAKEVLEAASALIGALGDHSGLCSALESMSFIPGARIPIKRDEGQHATERSYNGPGPDFVLPQR
ncbi:protein kinase [Ophiostoma piceae UAMH 11346]|uniref:Protein kinase n=1 Tax=Ophiostoma piceae (strain UAMH 11346) TaxID=1262450 RepID=S3CVS8_OPHP1|nr:protein kinase [Ophiostoma piceae UAMH 11346]